MTRTNPPKVSIVMATYNRSHQLKTTIENIMQQEYDDLELIVINDGSTDNTSDVLNQIQKTQNIRVIVNEKNVGLQKSLNIGIRHAKGEYIARIDDHDQWIVNNKLSKQVELLESNPELGIVGSGYRKGDKIWINPITDRAIRNQILMRSPFCHVSVLMRKSIVDKVGGYNETLPYSEDWDLWLKIGKHAQMANLPEIMVSIQEEDLSLSREYFLKQLPINRQIVNQYHKDYPRRTTAFLYHQFLRFFFAIIPINGWIHRIMKKGFQQFFELTPKKDKLGR